MFSFNINCLECIKVIAVVEIRPEPLTVVLDDDALFLGQSVAIQSGQKDQIFASISIPIKTVPIFKEVSHQILKHAWQLQTSK